MAPMRYMLFDLSKSLTHSNSLYPMVIIENEIKVTNKNEYAVLMTDNKWSLIV